jgi:hypothetical protein
MSAYTVCIVTLNCDQLHCADMFILTVSLYQWCHWILIMLWFWLICHYILLCVIYAVISWNIYLMWGLGYSLDNWQIFQSLERQMICLFFKASRPTQPPLRWMQLVKEPGHEAESAVWLRISWAINPLPVCLHVANIYFSDGQDHKFF